MYNNTWRPSQLFDYYIILFYQESALQLHASSDDVIIAVATSVHSSNCSILRNFLQKTIWQTFVTIFLRKNVLQFCWNLLSTNFNMVSFNDTVYSCVSMYYLHILHILSIYNARYACSRYVIGLSCNISKKYCKILEGKNLANLVTIILREAKMRIYCNSLPSNHYMASIKLLSNSRTMLSINGIINSVLWYHQ